MADNPLKDRGRETSTATTPRSASSQPGGLSRRQPSSLSRSPFTTIFQRWNDEMDRFFEDFGLPSRSIGDPQAVGAWSPQVEIFQRGNDLVVRADLPGLSKDDVHVEIRDDALVIEGERKQEREEEREGLYRNERVYGSFYRTIPLPEGTIADSAKATFKNGVLEVVLQAPPQEVSRGRRLEIKES